MFDKWKRQLPNGQWVRIKRQRSMIDACLKCDCAVQCDGIEICLERKPRMRTYLKFCKPPKGRE